MLNKLWLLFLVFSFGTLYSQMIESTSRTYHFDIDKTMEYEGISVSQAFEVVPARLKIRQLIEEELSTWYEKEGYKYEDESTYQERIIRKIEDIQPMIIHEVGVSSFDNCQPECFFKQGTLQFEIQLNGFRPFNIAIPLAEVESFRIHFSKLEYSAQKIAFNEIDQFVITYVKIFNPDNGKRYVFYNAEDETVKSPSFAISVPQMDL